jgi:hypothetical protein
MLNRDRRQARLLEREWAALRRNRNAVPPDALDPEVVEVVTLLDRSVGSEGPSPAFTEGLHEQLEARARAARGQTRPVAAPRPDERPLTERIWWLAGAGKLAAATLTLLACVLVGTVLFDGGAGDDDDADTGGVGAPAATAAGASAATTAPGESTGGTGGAVATPTTGGAAAAEPTATRMATAAAVAPTATSAAAGAAATATSAGTGTGEPIERFPLPGVGSGAISVGADAVWVAGDAAGVVWRVDPGTGAVVATIGVRGEPPPQQPSRLALAASGEQVWVAVPEEGALKRIDPATNTVAATITPGLTAVVEDTGAPPLALALDAGSLWVAATANGQVLRIDLATGTVSATIAIPEPARLLATGGSVWVAHGPAPAISRIDPATSAVVATIPLGGAAGVAAVDGLAATDGSVWAGIRQLAPPSTTPAADAVRFALLRIDTTTNAVADEIAWPRGRIAPETSFALASRGSTVWVVTAGQLGQLDATTGALATGEIPFPDDDVQCAGQCAGLAAGELAVWIAHRGVREIARIDPTILS